MKTFKNKRTGETATVVVNFENCYQVSGGEIVPKRFIEDSCDWEEVVEKDWEILSFRHNEDRTEWTLKNNSYCNGDACFSLNEMLFDKHTSLVSGEIRIHSVKRLSDNEAFSVGDRAQTIGKYPHTISSIEIRQKNKNRNEKDGIDRIWLNWENDCGGNWLEDTEKVKTPILTTVDGVELFGGESVYGVTNTFDLVYCSVFMDYDSIHLKIFAKKEWAERYIKAHQKKYSLKQVEKVLIKYLPLDTIYQTEIIEKILKNLQNEQ